MRKSASFSFLSLFLFFLLSCQHEEIEKRIVETYPDGKAKKIEYYSKNKQQVVKIETFYPNGQLQLSEEMKNGKPNGQATYYYPTGQKWSEGSFKDGKPHGLRKTYYVNGQLRYMGYYNNGKMEGEWIFYDENGKVLNKVKYP